MRAPTVWARAPLHLLEYAERFGARRAPLLAAAGIEARRLEDPDARIALPAYYSLVEGIAAALGDPYLAANYISEVQPDSLEAVGFLAYSSRTLGEGVRRIIRHHPMMDGGQVFALEIVGRRALFRFEPWGPTRLAHAYLAEMYAADCLILSVRMTGEPIAVRSFRLAHARIGEPAEYKRRYGRTPQFGAGVNEWSFDASVLERPMPQPDPSLGRFFEKLLAKRSPPAGPFRERVREAVAACLPDGDVSLAKVAARLQSTSRTLQRRLAAEGAQFEALVDQVRSRHALAYLEMDLPIAEVSFLLGFAEPPAFHRAFRRWTGTTPRQWRERRG